MMCESNQGRCGDQECADNYRAILANEAWHTEGRRELMHMSSPVMCSPYPVTIVLQHPSPAAVNHHIMPTVKSVSYLQHERLTNAANELYLG